MRFGCPVAHVSARNFSLTLSKTAADAASVDHVRTHQSNSSIRVPIGTSVTT